MDEDRELIARNLVEFRKEKGWSQAVLADQMRLAGHDAWRQNTVSRVESGQQGLGFDEIRSLTHILGGRLLEGTRLREELRAFAADIDSLTARQLLRQVSDHLDVAKQSVDYLRERLVGPGEEAADEHREAP